MRDKSIIHEDFVSEMRGSNIDYCNKKIDEISELLEGHICSANNSEKQDEAMVFMVYYRKGNDIITLGTSVGISNSSLTPLDTDMVAMRFRGAIDSRYHGG